jgi:hypothetical protein
VLLHFLVVPLNLFIYQIHLIQVQQFVVHLLVVVQVEFQLVLLSYQAHQVVEEMVEQE